MVDLMLKTEPALLHVPVPTCPLHSNQRQLGISLFRLLTTPCDRQLLQCTQTVMRALRAVRCQNKRMPAIIKSPSNTSHAALLCSSMHQTAAAASQEVSPLIAVCCIRNLVPLLNSSIPDQHAFALRTTGCNRVCKRLTHCSWLRAA
jgi:hypothetical protein